MWALKHAYNELSDNSAKSVANPCRTMFPDSKIARGNAVAAQQIKVCSKSRNGSLC